MVKVVYNNRYGGFSLSEKAVELYNQGRLEQNQAPINHSGRRIPRHDPVLIKVVEELGKEANGKHADLQIETIPDAYIDCYKITEYDGLEGVICDPAKLVQYKLKGKDTSNLTDMECRTLLDEIITILN